MPGIKELIRSEEDGTISFGNYDLRPSLSFRISNIRGTSTRSRHFMR